VLKKRPKYFLQIFYDDTKKRTNWITIYNTPQKDFLEYLKNYFSDRNYLARIISQSALQREIGMKGIHQANLDAFLINEIPYDDLFDTEEMASFLMTSIGKNLSFLICSESVFVIRELYKELETKNLKKTIEAKRQQFLDELVEGKRDSFQFMVRNIPVELREHIKNKAKKENKTLNEIYVSYLLEGYHRDLKN